MKSWLVVVMLAVTSCFAQPNGKDLYDRALNAMEGAQKRPADAATLMRESADAGYAPAQNALGYWLETGQVTMQFQAEAVEWYRKAAQQSDKFAWYALGRAYALGIGTAKDEMQARPWLAKSADAGNIYAEYLMALTYEGRDPEQYVAWLTRAAKDGLPQAELRLGNALRDGRGVARDPRGAYEWLLIAQQSGMEVVDERLRLLETELGSAAADIQRIARDRGDALRTKRKADPCSGFEGENNEPPALPPPDVQRKCR